MTASAKRPRLRKIDVRVPVRAMRGLDCRSPLLDAADRAVLRRIDGQSTVTAVASALGISAERTASALTRLEGLGLVAYVEPRPSAPTSSPPVRLQSGMRPAARTLPAIPPSATASGAPDDQPRPGVDAHARIEALHERLGALDHYELLGVPPDAHPMDVTLGYLALAAALHGGAAEDAHGEAHRAQRDAILAQATLAHETLTSSARRAEYDALRVRSAQAEEVAPRRTLAGIGPEGQ